MSHRIVKHPVVETCLRVAKKQRLAIFVGIGGGSVIYLGKYLVDLGSRGDHYAQTWGMIISLLSLLSSVWLGWQQLKRPHHQAVKTPEKQEQQRLTASHITVTLVVAIIAFTVPPLINQAAFVRWQTEDVTSRVTLKEASQLHNGDTARILLPASKHQDLAITISLTSLVRTGSCVSPARVTLTPTYSGNDGRPTRPFQSGELQIIPVNSNVPVELRAAIDLSEEPSCAVQLHVSFAQFRH